MFKKHVAQPEDRLDRVENIRVNGMFDVNFCSAGIESWLELKCHEEPTRPTTPLFGSGHKITQEQKNWALRQCKSGGRCFFLIETDRRWILIEGNAAEWINSATVNELIKRALFCQPKPLGVLSWTLLRDILNDNRDYSAK
jgi:hypothetical protein